MKRDAIGHESGRETEAKTKPRSLPNNAMHSIDEAIMEAMDALNELVPVLRGDKEMRYILASLVDRLYRIVLVLKEVRKS